MKSFVDLNQVYPSGTSLMSSIHALTFRGASASSKSTSESFYSFPMNSFTVARTSSASMLDGIASSLLVNSANALMIAV